MDRASQVNQVAGDDVFAPGPSDSSAWAPSISNGPRAQNLYEGTDSDDEEAMMMRNGRGSLNEATGRVSFPGDNFINTTVPFGFELQRGQLAPEGVKFMSFKAMNSYPYMFIGKANRHKVSRGFFDGSKLKSHTFDLFYLYEDVTGINPNPLVLVPSKQFERLLDGIYERLNIKLSIPKGEAGDRFWINFLPDGNPMPRYLGRSTNKEQFEKLTFNFPPYNHKSGDESPTFVRPSKAAAENFKINFRALNPKNKGTLVARKKENKEQERAVRRTNCAAEVRNVQGWLGLKPQHVAASNFNTSVWDTNPEATIDGLTGLSLEDLFDPSKAAKNTPDEFVVFIAVDVECYELDHSKVTEIGIATLDTFDLVNREPGTKGDGWTKCLRARHFRILEHRHLRNVDFVGDYADNFDFGQSEFVPLKDVKEMVNACFKQPFSRTEEPTSAQHYDPARKVILVGHNINTDIEYLKVVGVDLTKIPLVQNTIDTENIIKHIKKTDQTMKLSIVLYELGIEAWHAHNAGNDAVFTVQAMVGLTIKYTLEQQDLYVKSLKKQSRSNIDDHGWVTGAAAWKSLPEPDPMPEPEQKAKWTVGAAAWRGMPEPEPEAQAAQSTQPATDQVPPETIAEPKLKIQVKPGRSRQKGKNVNQSTAEGLWRAPIPFKKATDTQNYGKGIAHIQDTGEESDDDDYQFNANGVSVNNLGGMSGLSIQDREESSVAGPGHAIGQNGFSKSEVAFNYGPKIESLWAKNHKKPSTRGYGYMPDPRPEASDDADDEVETHQEAANGSSTTPPTLELAKHSDLSDSSKAVGPYQPLESGAKVQEEFDAGSPDTPKSFRYWNGGEFIPRDSPAHNNPMFAPPASSSVSVQGRAGFGSLRPAVTVDDGGNTTSLLNFEDEPKVEDARDPFEALLPQVTRASLTATAAQKKEFLKLVEGALQAASAHEDLLSLEM